MKKFEDQNHEDLEVFFFIGATGASRPLRSAEGPRFAKCAGLDG